MTECIMERRQGYCDGCNECGGPSTRTCCIPDCTTPVARTSELPVCRSCGIKIALAHQFDAERVNAVKAEEVRQRRRREAEREAQRQRLSWVYYIDLGQHIKIGYTSNIKRRLAELRAYPHQLLALEPGGRGVEKARHHQFRAARVDAREHFAHAPEVMEHIAATLERHGLPLWATTPSGPLTISRIDAATE